jgi:arsenate reductase (thioredoxin)
MHESRVIGGVAMAMTLALAATTCSGRNASPSGADIVFVCEHGAAKSVIAAEYFNREAEKRGLTARAVARGADPQREPSAKTHAGLASDGFRSNIDIPRLLNRADIHDESRVIVFDCPEPAMSALRAMGDCWDDTPPVSDGYEGTRDAIRLHVRELVEQLVRRSTRAKS